MAERSLGEMLMGELGIDPQNPGVERGGDFLKDLNSARISARNGDFDLTDFYVGEIIRGQGDIPSESLVMDLNGLRLLSLVTGRQKFPEIEEDLNARIQYVATFYLRPRFIPITPLSDPAN